MKKYFVLTIALSVVTLAFAQKHEQSHHPKNPELRKELQEFKKNSIIPMMEKAQAEFDAQLSTEDLKFINEKRAEATQKREKAIARKKEMRKQREETRKKFENDPEARKKFHKELREKRQARKHELSPEMKSFLERNQELIASSLKDLKSEKEALKQEVEAIFEKHNVDRSDMENFRREKMRRHRGKKGFHGKRDHQHRRDSLSKEMREERINRHKNRKAIKFLLWNKEMRMSENRGVDVLSPQLNQNFPNPASNETTIQFELPEQVESVEITIVDLNGKLVRSMNLANLEKGDHQVNINLEGISNGTYFYTVKAGDFVQTKKMIISK